MFIPSFAYLFFLLLKLILVSGKNLHEICEVLNINNPVACNENKVSSLKIQEYQRTINYLEHDNNRDENIVLLEELYYYYGLKLSLDPFGNNELDAISQWEKIQKTKYLVKLKESKLDELYLKFGEFNKLKSAKYKHLVETFETLNLDEQLQISPLNYNLISSKNVVLWNDLKKAINIVTNEEQEEDTLIIVATELSSNYQLLLNKYKKKLTLNEKAKYFAILADIEFLILTNFKKSQLYAKNCIEFDDLNKHCLELIKINNKILKNKNCSPADGPFDPLEINKKLNTKWAHDFNKMLNDKKGKNTFSSLNTNTMDYYASNTDSFFKDIYKNTPYFCLLQTWKIISNDLISHHVGSIGKKKIQAILKIMKYDKLKTHTDITLNLNADLLNKIWNNQSPYFAVNIIKCFIETREFQNKKVGFDIKQLVQFLQEKRVLDKSEHELDHFTHTIISDIKQHYEQTQAHERKVREQQHQQFFQQHFQQQGGGSHNFFNGFRGSNQHDNGHRNHQPPPEHQQFSKEKDYYKILKVDPKATSKEIRKSYLNMIKQYHPDKLSNLSEKEEKEMETLVHNINEAYEVLYDDAKRSDYDLFRTGRW